MKCSIAHLSKERKAALKKKDSRSMTLKNYLFSTKCVHVRHVNCKESVSTIMSLHTQRAWLFVCKRFTVDAATGYK